MQVAVPNEYLLLISVKTRDDKWLSSSKYLFWEKQAALLKQIDVFKRILQYFIFVTTKIGLEVYDPLNFTHKTITATIPSETHTQVLKEMKILAKIGIACLLSC